MEGSQLPIKSRNFVAKITCDSAGRKGKTVTVIDGLPKEIPFLQTLLKILKKSCGAGGTVITDRRDGVLELQGDHREKIQQFLEKENIKTIVK